MKIFILGFKENKKQLASPENVPPGLHDAGANPLESEPAATRGAPKHVVGGVLDHDKSRATELAFLEEAEESEKGLEEGVRRKTVPVLVGAKNKIPRRSACRGHMLRKKPNIG